MGIKQIYFSEWGLRQFKAKAVKTYCFKTANQTSHHHHTHAFPHEVLPASHKHVLPWSTWANMQIFRIPEVFLWRPTIFPTLVRTMATNCERREVFYLGDNLRNSLFILTTTPAAAVTHRWNLRHKECVTPRRSATMCPPPGQLKLTGLGPCLFWTRTGKLGLVSFSFPTLAQSRGSVHPKLLREVQPPAPSTQGHRYHRLPRGCSHPAALHRRTGTTEADAQETDTEIPWCSHASTSRAARECLKGLMWGRGRPRRPTPAAPHRCVLGGELPPRSLRAPPPAPGSPRAFRSAPPVHDARRKPAEAAHREDAAVAAQRSASLVTGRSGSGSMGRPRCLCEICTCG